MERKILTKNEMLNIMEQHFTYREVKLFQDFDGTNQEFLELNPEFIERLLIFIPNFIDLQSALSILYIHNNQEHVLKNYTNVWVDTFPKLFEKICHAYPRITIQHHGMYLYQTNRDFFVEFCYNHSLHALAIEKCGYFLIEDDIELFEKFYIQTRDSLESASKYRAFLKSRNLEAYKKLCQCLEFPTTSVIYP